jgi:hypothetical protein
MSCSVHASLSSSPSSPTVQKEPTAPTDQPEQIGNAIYFKCDDSREFLQKLRLWTTLYPNNVIISICPLLHGPGYADGYLVIVR